MTCSKCNLLTYEDEDQFYPSTTLRHKEDDSMSDNFCKKNTGG